MCAFYTKCAYICSVEEVVWLIVKPPKAWVCACTYLLSACCVSLLLQSSVEWISSSLLMGSCILLLLLPPCYWVFTRKSTGSCFTLLFFSGGPVRTRKSTGSCIVDLSCDLLSSSWRATRWASASRCRHLCCESSSHLALDEVVAPVEASWRRSICCSASSRLFSGSNLWFCLRLFA